MNGGTPSNREVQGDAPERPQIAWRPHGAPRPPARGHVRGRAGDQAPTSCCRARRRWMRSRSRRVWRPHGGDENVAGLDVPVDDALAVGPPEVVSRRCSPSSAVSAGERGPLLLHELGKATGPRPASITMQGRPGVPRRRRTPSRHQGWVKPGARSRPRAAPSGAVLAPSASLSWGGISIRLTANRSPQKGVPVPARRRRCPPGPIKRGQAGSGLRQPPHLQVSTWQCQLAPSRRAASRRPPSHDRRTSSKAQRRRIAGAWPPPL